MAVHTVLWMRIIDDYEEQEIKLQTPEMALLNGVKTWPHEDWKCRKELRL